MKLFIIIILGISSLQINSTNGEKINYNPRLLQKELSDLLCEEDYRMEELLLPDSITGNSKVNGKFFKIVCGKGENYHAYIGRVNSRRAGDYSIQENNESEEEFEYFDYFILFDSQVRVKLVRVQNYEATYGHEITVKGWLKQFIGFDGTKPLRVGKEIDSIAGATISATRITDDIQLKTSFLKSLEKF